MSFFVVFFAEAKDAHANTILLLDEPGLSLHGLKQREFRQTISRLAEGNQTIYTTHSPFLVGPDELDLVRVVEMTDRDEGTKVHTSVTASDPAALLPLQEALGYDLAQRGYVNRCVNDIRRRPSQPLIQWRFHPHTVHRGRRLRSTQGPSDA